MIDTWAPGRFRLLLLSLLLLFVGLAAATGSDLERPVNVILLAIVIVAAVLDLRDRGHRGRFAIGLVGSVIILMSVANLAVRIKHLPVLADALMALFSGFVVWRAYAAVMRRQRPVGDRIVGAIGVYVLFGLAWAKVYETLDGAAPGSFRFPADTGWATPSALRYGYFSFVTLATTGYGDVIPVTVLAGTLAWMEAISGQLYLAITVARLVALSIADGSGSDTTTRA